MQVQRDVADGGGQGGRDYQVAPASLVCPDVVIYGYMHRLARAPKEKR